MQCQSNEALVVAEYNIEKSIEIYADIIERQKFMNHIPVGDLYRDYQNYADLLEQADKYKESAEYYRKAIEIIMEIQSEDSPALSQPYIGMANCNMGLQQYEKAIDYLTRIEKIAGDNYLLKRVVYHKKAVCYSNLKNYETAINLLLNALDYCKDTPGTDPGYIYVDLSWVFRYMENIPESDKYKKLAAEFAKREDESCRIYVNTFIHKLCKK